MDFVIMFMFSDNALQLALNTDPSLWRWAYEKHVVITGSQNLFPLLRVLEMSWNQVRQVENLHEIMKTANLVIDRVQLFSERFEAVEDAFRYDRMVLCAPTYDGGIMPIMEDFINHLRIKTYQNRKVAFVENGTWAPASGKKMREQMEAMKNITIIEPLVTVESTVKAKTIEDLKVLADALIHNA